MVAMATSRAVVLELERPVYLPQPIGWHKTFLMESDAALTTSFEFTVCNHLNYRVWPGPTARWHPQVGFRRLSGQAGEKDCPAVAVWV